MTTPWAHLSNAKHIDCILKSTKDNPHEWNYDYTKITCSMAQDLYNGLWDDEWEIAVRVINKTGRQRIWNNIDNIPDFGAMERSPLVALVAYDDCGYMIDSDPGELGILAAFGNQRAMLILPAAIVFAEIKKAELVAEAK